MDEHHAQVFAQEFEQIKQVIGQAIVGQTSAVGLALTTLLAGGHLLVEDVPGTGKTSLAKALAAVIDGQAGRVQFTPDLLPSDVVGANVYDQRTGTFEFKPGPVFCQIMLGDEINRASPKTQSALLEVMEEHQVTLDGQSRAVGRPFMVIATQNPVEQLGTYPLPEAQLDRFMVCTTMGHPDRQAALRVVSGAAAVDRTTNLSPVTSARRVVELQELAQQVHVAESVLDYLLAVCQATREDPRCVLGVSLRGALALTRCAKVHALAQARSYMTPADVKALARPVLAHRLKLTPDALIDGATAGQVIDQVMSQVAPPTEAGIEAAA